MGIPTSLLSRRSTSKSSGGLVTKFQEKGIIRSECFVFAIVTVILLSILSTACRPLDSENHPTVPSIPDSINSVDVIISDMANPHEGHPHGVPTSWDWYSQPVVSHALPTSGYAAYTCHGQFYEDLQETLATNTRVHIRNLRTYYLSRSLGIWLPLQEGQPIDGKWFLETHSDGGIVADTRVEASGGISATTGYGPSEGRCYHFWPRDRAVIDPQDIDGIYVTLEARLIIDNPELPDDRHLARYILNVGADYWTTETEGTNSNEAIGLGRFKYVATYWRHFNFCTVSAGILSSNPPPM